MGIYRCDRTNPLLPHLENHHKVMYPDLPYKFGFVETGKTSSANGHDYVIMQRFIQPFNNGGYS